VKRAGNGARISQHVADLCRNHVLEFERWQSPNGRSFRIAIYADPRNIVPIAAAAFDGVGRYQTLVILAE
jgi:hypothetical protein